MALDLNDISAWIRAAAPGGRLVSDSRRVGRGDVFFAYPGEGAADGRNYIRSALEKGAAAVVFEARDFAWSESAEVPHLAVPELKKNAGAIAHAFYGQPDAGMFTVGVTGTNGKTSIALWTAQALARLGSVDEGVAVIGTLGVGLVRVRVEPEFDATGYTTPDAVLLATRLASLRDSGASALAIEVSSIGLAEERTAGMHFDVAVFTNLTRDHLDYHGDMASYEAAKLKLFEWPGLKHAVLNLDDPAGGRIAAHLRAQRPEVAITGYTARSEDEQPALEGVAMLRATQLRTPPGRRRVLRRYAVGQRAGPHPPGRPLQRQQRAGGAGRAAGQGRAAARRAGRHRHPGAGPGPHAADRRRRRTAGRDRLRTHAGRAGKGAGRAAPGGA
jgi:UDP-N-acetylmuramoyl-L-alanyl-D-glutamate--2,6-diaminopimelate ligase